MLRGDARSAILKCIRSESFGPIEDFIQTLIDIDETDDLHHTLLRHAVGFATNRDWRSPGAILVVKYLIGRGANVNYKNPRDKYYNLLCCAAFHGCIEVLEALREAGLVMETPLDRTPPLSHAQYEPLMVKYLIDIGCDPNYKDEHNTTILMEVAEKGQPDSVRVLLDAGAKLDIVDTYGYNALNYAQGTDNVAGMKDVPLSGYEKRPLICRLIRAEIARRAEMKVAFAMAGIHRLGVETGMNDFDIEVLNMILKQYE